MRTSFFTRLLGFRINKNDDDGNNDFAPFDFERHTFERESYRLLITTHGIENLTV